ncbi:MAG: Maf family protein [Spirochaetales bacterium]|jgi:septum formation protein|nr:Maf family protein [Spirochaetales bacterium]
MKPPRPVLLLASASARRAELLALAGLPFRVCPRETDETFSRRPPGAEAVRLARQKLDSLLLNLPAGENPKTLWALGADTFILPPPALRGAPSFLGKPENREEARRMLLRLSGRTHRVITGLALACPPGRVVTAWEITKVRFAPLSAGEIEAYLGTGEWAGAAGAYRIQGRGEALTVCIKGSYSNIMGLPLNRLCAILKANGYPFP